MTLKIISPDKTRAELLCDSIVLTVQAGEKGTEGGAYGIRKGHASSLIATDKGRITARLENKTVYDELHGRGFASIDNDTVTVFCDN